MKCLRCKAILSSVDNGYKIRYLEETSINRIDCSACGFCIALNFNGIWIPIDNILTYNGTEKHGWIEVCTSEEKEVLFTLSQIFYREFEAPDKNRQEAVFDLPDPNDLMKILWVECNAIGFYTMKLKGTMIYATMDCYAMHTLDTAYILKSQRSKGYGKGLLSNLIETYPNEDIGFSKPISCTMLKVLKKFLIDNVSCRNRFWELNGPGGEGNQKLIWYSFH